MEDETQITTIISPSLNEIPNDHNFGSSTDATDELMTRVTHELRTPLCIFKSVIDNALDGLYGPIKSDLKSQLRNANDAILRIKKLIDSYDKLQQLDSDKINFYMEKVCLQDVLKIALMQFRHKAKAMHLNFRLIMPTDNIFIYCDKLALYCIFSYLTDNAINNCSNKGQIEFIATRKDDNIEIAINDNGSGIDPVEFSRIFDRFVQINKKDGPGGHGLGLGLTIVKELIIRQAGNIWLDNNGGLGTYLKFTLPEFRGQQQLNVKGRVK